MKTTKKTQSTKEAFHFQNKLNALPKDGKIFISDKKWSEISTNRISSYFYSKITQFQNGALSFFRAEKKGLEGFYIVKNVTKLKIK